ncbi:hypothetical protein J9303_18415 [Bacillaceae bacterium Marseille-Q3522]|nr:hypothetical protein [Bacillaceae bacterium Marseille-Q3522]
MKNLIFISLVLLVGIFIMSGCDPDEKDKMEFYQQTASTDLTDEKIHSITLNSQEDEAIKQFGEPDSIEKIENPASSYFIYLDSNSDKWIEFQIINKHVQRISFSSADYQTTKGISPGLTKEDIQQSYGKYYYERSETGSKVIGYFDKTAKINLEFSFHNEKINGIMLSAVTDSKK